MESEHLKLIGKAIYYGICIAAVFRGDRPLRLAAAAIAANALLSPLGHWGHVRGDPYYAVIALDLGLLVFLAGLLARHRRWWLVLATSFFLLSLLTHFAALIGGPINARVTLIVRVLWCYAMVLAVGWGVVMHEFRRRKAGLESLVRALIAEQGEVRARAELDRRYLSASNAAERADAARLVETIRQLTEAH